MDTVNIEKLGNIRILLASMTNSMSEEVSKALMHVDKAIAKEAMRLVKLSKKGTNE